MQAVKMAWKSIWGKKGRSTLTILGIFIGIAAVMTIVSVMEGMKELTRQQYEAMGSNRITVHIWSYLYDEEGNSLAPDYFPKLYEYCNGLKDQVEGVTPEGYSNATVVYGTKSTANMGYEWDENGNMIGEAPPNLYYASDQYSVCNNLTVVKGRDLAYLDMTNYSQVCVMGAQAAKTFFGSGNPVGQELQVNGNPFLVVGVYGSRMSEESAMGSNLDNFIAFPYTARRILGGEAPSQFTVKAKSGVDLAELVPTLSGFVKGLVGSNGSYNVESANQYQDYQNEYLTQISVILGGIAAISLLVGGIGIMNIMLVTVTERTREIGIRRAIGAQRASIVAQFLIEAAMLCGIGGIVGILVGTAGSLILCTLLIQITVYPPTWVTAAAFALSVALGLLFGSYPAMKAAKLQPVEALRAD